MHQTAACCRPPEKERIASFPLLASRQHSSLTHPINRVQKESLFFPLLIWNYTVVVLPSIACKAYLEEKRKLTAAAAAGLLSAARRRVYYYYVYNGYVCIFSFFSPQVPLLLILAERSFLAPRFKSDLTSSRSMHHEARKLPSKQSIRVSPSGHDRPIS